MFKIIDVDQGSEAWFQARLGRITASNFSKVVTKTGKLSASSKDVINRAVAELILGEPDDSYKSEAMERGNMLEDDALDFFNFTKGYNFKKCGFMDSTLGYGNSPDGLDVEKKIGLELKCPSPHTHLAYLSGNRLPPVYEQQVQGSLFVSGYKQWVFGSYHPELPCFSIVVERDEAMIANMKKLIIPCCNEIRVKTAELRELINVGV